jgi:hypothetical protein
VDDIGTDRGRLVTRPAKVCRVVAGVDLDLAYAPPADPP